MIIYSRDSGPIVYPKDSAHDPSSKKYYRLDWRPEFRESSKAYIKDVDVVIPVINNGCMYECISGGISSPDVIDLETIEGKSVVDGTVRWKCVPYSGKIAYSDSITASTWEADDPLITLYGVSVILDGHATMVRVDSVPTTSKSFVLTNTVDVLRASGLVERFEKRIKIGVLQL